MARSPTVGRLAADAPPIGYVAPRARNDTRHSSRSPKPRTHRSPSTYCSRRELRLRRSSPTSLAAAYGSSPTPVRAGNFRLTISLFPQSDNEAVIFFDQVWFGTVMSTHGSDDSIRYARAQVLNGAVISKRFPEQFVPSYPRSNLHLLHSHPVRESTGRNYFETIAVKRNFDVSANQRVIAVRHRIHDRFSNCVQGKRPPPTPPSAIEPSDRAHVPAYKTDRSVDDSLI